MCVARASFRSSSRWRGPFGQRDRGREAGVSSGQEALVFGAAGSGRSTQGHAWAFGLEVSWTDDVARSEVKDTTRCKGVEPI